VLAQRGAELMKGRHYIDAYRVWGEGNNFQIVFIELYAKEFTPTATNFYNRNTKPVSNTSLLHHSPSYMCFPLLCDWIEFMVLARQIQQWWQRRWVSSKKHCVN